MRIFGRHAKELVGFAAVLLLCVACGHISVRHAMPGELREAVSASTSNMNGYQLTAAEWVGEQPLLVNSDFDMSMAMMMDMGAAIAAGKRKQDNEAAAQLLQAVPPLVLSAKLDAALERCGADCGWMNGRVVRVYGLLFGRQQARLQTVLEVLPEFVGDRAIQRRRHPLPLRFIAVSGALPFAPSDSESTVPATAPFGHSSWSVEQGAAIVQASTTGVEEVVQLARTHGDAVRAASVAAAQLPAEEVWECSVGDGARHSGRALGKVGEGGRVPMLLLDPPHTVVVCDSEAMSKKPAEPPEMPMP